MKTKIKLILKKYLPENLFVKIKVFYVKYLAKYFDDNKVVQKYTKFFLQKNGANVIDGPFKDMKYVKNSVGSSYLHKLAGYYESILHPYLFEIKNLPINNILDIGAAEGYYTTGFARYFPQANIVAFEMDEAGKYFISEMMKINDLKNNLQILGEATNKNIENFLSPNTLLIVDCEGAEKEILNIENKNLYENVLFGIIELHDNYVPGCKTCCVSYFEKTHDIEIVRFRHANINDFSFLKNVDNKTDLEILLKERGIQDQERLILRKKGV